jgi:hypothetical protein
MAKARSTDAKLERLRLLRDEPPSPAAALELQTCLRDASNHVVGNAAALVARFHFKELAPEMVAAAVNRRAGNVLRTLFAEKFPTDR